MISLICQHKHNISNYSGLSVFWLMAKMVLHITGGLINNQIPGVVALL